MTGVYFLTSRCLTPLLLLSPAGSTFIWQKERGGKEKSERKSECQVVVAESRVHSCNIYSAYFVQFPATAVYKAVTIMTFSVLSII